MTYYSPWKAVHHPERLAAIKAGEPVAPANVQVDLEGYCPHRCQFCSYKSVGWQAHGMRFSPPERVSEGSGLPREIALALPQQLAALGTRAVEITGGGEPLASPYALDFLSACEDAGLQVALITNGMLLTARARACLCGAAWVRFSLDAATPRTYSRVHGVPERVFAHVLENASAYLAERDPACKVGVSFVITPDNAEEIPAAAHLYRELGFDNVRYTVTYEPTGTAWLEAITQVDELLAEAKAEETPEYQVFGATYRLDYYRRPNTDFDRCYSQRFVWAIGTDALVYPCCIQKYHDGFALGDLRTESLIQIAERQARTWPSFDVRRCKPCWLRDKNQFVSYLLETDPPHVEFV